MTEYEVDLLIVGAGPAGLYAAYYAGFRGLRTAIIDSLPAAGGQVSALYPEKMIYDVAGFPKIRGRELVDALVEQAAAFDPTYLLGHRAVTLDRNDESGVLTVGSDDGVQVHSKAVLVTGGIGTFAPRPLPADDGTWEGRGLYYFMPAFEEFTGQDVVIVGGGDSAMDWAIALEPLASSVTVVHRRDTFRAHKYTVDLVRNSSAELVINSEVSRILGDAAITGVELTGRTDSTLTRTIPVQSVIAALGFTADLGPLLSWGLETRSRRICVDRRFATSIPGVFAAGDIAEYDGKVRLISVGFGEAASAVNNAAVVIDPKLRLDPGHSSDAPPEEAPVPVA
ncbi:MAG: NAD(P)/FAD-dependent oxidoreductase [Mycobacteriales bacterium]